MSHHALPRVLTCYFEVQGCENIAIHLKGSVGDAHRGCIHMLPSYLPRPSYHRWSSMTTYDCTCQIPCHMMLKCYDHEITTLMLLTLGSMSHSSNSSSLILRRF